MCFPSPPLSRRRNRDPEAAFRPDTDPVAGCGCLINMGAYPGLGGLFSMPGKVSRSGTLLARRIDTFHVNFPHTPASVSRGQLTEGDWTGMPAAQEDCCRGHAPISAATCAFTIRLVLADWTRPESRPASHSSPMAPGSSSGRRCRSCVRGRSSHVRSTVDDLPGPRGRTAGGLRREPWLGGSTAINQGVIS